MFKLTKKADYGLALVTALARCPDTLTSLKTISNTQHLPYKFIGQVASALSLAGIVSSKEGASGGYRLAKPATKTTLLEVINALDGPSVQVDCLAGKKCPKEHSCRHRPVLSKLSHTLNQMLSRTTIADLLE